MAHGGDRSFLEHVPWLTCTPRWTISICDDAGGTWICWNRGGLLAANAASFSAMDALRVRISA